MGAPLFVGSSSAFTNAASATVTVGYPTDSMSGDLLVMSVVFRRSTSAAYTVATPTDWNLIETNNQSTATGGLYAATYWRFRGSETSVVPTASVSTLMYATATIHAYRGDIDPVNPIDANAITYSTVTATAKAVPGVTTTVPNTKISLFLHYWKTTASTHTWAAPAMLQENYFAGSNADLVATSALVNNRPAGATGDFTANTSFTSSGANMAATVAIRPYGAKPVYIGELHSNGASSATQAYNYPADSLSGDLMILFAHSRGGTASSSAAAPSGWNQISVNNQFPNTPGGSGSWVYWRFRGAETSVTHVISSAPSTIYQWGTVMAIDGATVDPTNPIAAVNNAMDMNGGATPLPIPTVTTSLSNILLYSGMYDGTGAVRTVIWDNPAIETNDTCVNSGSYRGATNAVYLTPPDNTLISTTATSSSTLPSRRIFNVVAVQPVQTGAYDGRDMLPFFFSGF